MPTTSSLQTVNDANGSTYAFLEDNGYLWQCQWNPDAQRWDKGQVVPGAYGGENLQAALVANLWPTSGIKGNQQGNTAGIVLAYRIGKGEAAKVYGTLGRWGSNGELEWKAPLLLSGSGTVIEAMALRASGNGGFELVSQRREPLAADQGTTLESIIGARSDSELIRQSFDLSGSDRAGYSLNDRTDPKQTPPGQLVTPAEDPLPVAAVGATGDEQQLNRNTFTYASVDTAASPSLLLREQGGGAGTLSFQALEPLARTGAQADQRSGASYPLIITGTTKRSTVTQGFLPVLSGVKHKWSIQYPAASPAVDWTGGDRNGNWFRQLFRTPAIPILENPYGVNLSTDPFELERSKPENTYSLNGSFGFGGYGSQSVKNSAGFSFKHDNKWDSAGFKDAFESAKKGLSGAKPLEKRSAAFVLSGSLDTTYNYTSLLPRRAAEPGWLKSVTNNFIISAGFELQERKRTMQGHYLQALIGGSVGFTMKMKRNSVDEAGNKIPELESWLGYLGYSAGIAGSAFAYASMANTGFSGDNRLKNMDKIKGNKDWIRRATIADYGLDYLGAAIGISTMLAPTIAMGGPNEVGSQYGLMVKGMLNGRFLYRGLAGAYLNTNYTYTRYNMKPDVEKAHKLTLDFGLAFPFGVSVPLYAAEFKWPKPEQTVAGLQATQTTKETEGTPLLETNSNPLPYLYIPASGSVLIPSAGVNDQGMGTGAVVANKAESLRLFSLAAYAKGQVSQSAQSSAAVVLTNPGSGLKDGDWKEVAILGNTLPGSAPSTLNFRVLNGEVQAESVEINAPAKGDGLYLLLPETTPDSGAYALIPDVLSMGLLPSDTRSSSQGFQHLLNAWPVLTVRTNKANSPLSAEAIAVIAQVIPLAAINAEGDEPTAIQPNPTPSDNSLQTYTRVPIAIADRSTSTLNITPLNHPTATVGISNGRIVKVNLETPLYISLPETLQGNSQNSGLPDIDLTLDVHSPPLGFDATIANPTYTVKPQSLGFKNVAEESSYRANPGFPGNTGAEPGAGTQHAKAVWLAEGINDEWQQTPSQGPWPVFNRVVVQSADGRTEYLNAFTVDANGKKRYEVLDAADVHLDDLYLKAKNGQDFPHFSAASSPTAIDIANGTKFASAVFWVEASDTVIPISSTDSNTSYQDFLTSYYGKQRINYRLYSKAAQAWETPTAATTFYAPKDAIIRDLKGFNVEIGGSTRTLLVWDETSISTIKGTAPEAIAIQGWIDADTLTIRGASNGLRIGDLITGNGVKQGTVVLGIETAFDPGKQQGSYKLSRSQSIGSSSELADLNATPLLPPSILKAGIINPNAQTVHWEDLFKDAKGNTTISTIPWDQTNDIGVGIESISVASQQIVAADGSVQDSAVLSWSENVRTPYVQSVLNDEPLIYLQFANLRPGLNDINIGSTAAITSTGTEASSTGLNFSIAGALNRSNASAVQNTDGTGVIATGTGSQNALWNSVINSTPINQRPESPFSQLTGSIDGLTLTVTALSGALAVGDLLTGPGLIPDSKISAVLSAFDPSTGTGSYSLNRSQSLSSRALEAVALPEPSSAMDLGLPHSTFSGSINGSILSVSQLSGSLNVGDQIIGEGVKLGTSIDAVISVDAASGERRYQLSANPLQQGNALPPSALIATPSSSLPYTIEFWAKLPEGSNANQGAGLVAFGQPSEAAVGAAVAPSGWLLTSTFNVQRFTYQQAATDGFQDAYNAINSNAAKGNDLYAWGWSLEATGANTTALGGNGGSNLYSNALTLTNLYSGQSISGVDAFLANYGLTAEDLVSGDGLYANTIDLVPTTWLEFNHSRDASSGQLISNLNGIGIETASAQLNSGLVLTDASGQLATDASKSRKLQAMFQSLWDYQESYASAKVAFTLNPADTSTRSNSGFEQYGGLALEFAVSPGPAISVNSAGNLVFDVANGVSITSAATTPSDQRQSALAADLRDGEWHHVVATYLPDYRTYTVSGTVTQVPTNRGTASLYVDNQLVGFREGVTNAFLPTNENDKALLLANNAGGAIDHFALYNKALLPAPPLLSNPGGAWPEPSTQEALAIFKQLGYPASESTPNPGAIESALTEHWRSRNVNPDGALLATYSSTFTPTNPTSLTGSWSEAAPLNPSGKPIATIPSGQAPALQQNLVITIDDNSVWSKALWSNGSLTNVAFNPGGTQLQGITVSLKADDDSLVTRVLSPEQIVMGQSSTLAALQPRATSANLDYTFLSNKPTLSLQIAQTAASGTGDSGDLDLNKTYTATVTLKVNSPTSATSPDQEYKTTLAPSRVFTGSDGRAATGSNEGLNRSRSEALATAAVLEEAPLQLQYIDSGVVLDSATAQEATYSPATPSPAPTFGQSMAYGWYESDTPKNYSGWLAVAQPSSVNAISSPSGRVWIQYTGDFTIDSETQKHSKVSTTSKAPKTWLNALAKSNFSPEAPNRPHLHDATHPAGYGGLLIKADPTDGWGQNFGQTMLVEDINGDGVKDLVISAPSANSGGKVVIIDGKWIQDNLTNAAGSTVLNLASPDTNSPYVSVLSPKMAVGSEDSSQSSFGWALAFDNDTKILFIGAPNYSRKVGPDLESVPIGAVYQYKTNGTDFPSGKHELTDPTLGIAGRSDTNDVGGPATTYWGANLGASLAVSKDISEGTKIIKLAIGAPGVQASLLYSGTQAVENLVAGDRHPSTPYGQGALVKVMLPKQITATITDAAAAGLDVVVSSSEGTSNRDLVAIVANNTTDKKSLLAAEESAYMQALKELQTRPIAKANDVNNPAIQTAAVGSVYLFDKVSLLTAGTLLAQDASATFYGPNPWNINGPTDFGASLSFGDSTNKNHENILAVGAPSSGGPGAVYLLNTDQPFSNPDNSNAPTWIQNTNLGNHQYLAHLTSGLTLYGSQDLDQFGSGLVNLGDTSGDAYDDLLIQAPNTAVGAGTGYVLFGNDQLVEELKDNNKEDVVILGGHNPAVGSVRPGSIGKLKFADGEQITIPILSEIGYGVAAATGLGSYGAGDVNADGINDIQLGSGSNAQAYLTYGKTYLEAIDSLQLDKLASDTGYMLTGLATTNQGSLRSIGDFNDDGYGDYMSIQPGGFLDTVRIELGGNTQDILANYDYNFYTFQVVPGTEVIAAGDMNGDGFSDIALFLPQNVTGPDMGNAGAGSTTAILYGRANDQLPLGAAFGLIGPVSGPDNGLSSATSPALATNTPLAPLPVVNLSGTTTDVAPTFLAVGNTIYAIIKGTGRNSLHFNQSHDGGNTWSQWTDLTAANPSLKSWQSASLAWFDDKLYLGFLNTSNQLALASWDPSSVEASNWSNATIISDGHGAFSSHFSPQLLSDGTGLSISWVSLDDSNPASGTLNSSFSTNPDGLWEPIAGGGTSPYAPAMVRDGDVIFMARVGNDKQMYWTQSKDGGQSWSSWQQLPQGMTSNDAPSLAIVNHALYLTYLGESNQFLNITRLENSVLNQWRPQVTINDQAAKQGYGAVAIGETIDGSEGLAIYYVVNDSSGTILRTYARDPLTSSSYTAPHKLGTQDYAPGYSSSGSLAVTRFNGNTYLAYPGGIPGSPSTTAYIASAQGADPGLDNNWLTTATQDTGNNAGIGLSSIPTGLLLNTTDSRNNQQVTYLLKDAAGSFSLFSQRASAANSATQKTAAILAAPLSGTSDHVLLQAAADNKGANSIVVSTNTPLWVSPQSLLERSESNLGTSFQPIIATAAPSATLLNGVPVLAVNNTGSITIYAGAGGRIFTPFSTFSPGDSNGAGTTTAGITTTNTGLAVSYRNTDGTVSLERLNILNLDGSPIQGVLITPDGSIDASGANLQWQGINLGGSSGVTSELATSPLNVNGTLQIGSISNRPGQQNAVQLHAVPQLNSPESVTWLNSTIQLADNDGSWLVQQLAGAHAPAALALPWTDTKGQSPTAPVFAQDAGTGVVYTAVQGTDHKIYWNNSTDGGRSWGQWRALPSGMTTNAAPALAVHNGRLVLAYLGQNIPPLINITSAPIVPGSSSLQWETQYQITTGNGDLKGKSISMVGESSDGARGIGLYIQADDDAISRAFTTTPTARTGWVTNSIQYTYPHDDTTQSANQTSSGPLAATVVDGTTYLAYQGGTSSKPSNTIYMTSSADQATASSWTLISNVPQQDTASHSGVGLTHVNGSLVLSYADQLNNQPVVTMQQGIVTAQSWLGTPYSLVQSVGTTAMPQTSLFAPSGSSAVLVGTINAKAGNEIHTVLASAQPLDQLLGASQTRSTLQAVGDIIGNDGFADLLVTASNVVANTATGAQLATGLRVIRGAATSSQILANSNSTATSQSVKLAAPFGSGSIKPVASLIGGDANGTFKLNISATKGSTETSLNLVVSGEGLGKEVSSVDDARSLLATMDASSIVLSSTNGWGEPEINGAGSYGDLNGDGQPDFFDPSGNGGISAVEGLAYSLWSIRPAGDVNGNGVDDVLLALAPQGPAYGQVISGQPSALHSVLVDGSLFKVSTSNSFRLDQLEAPLDPYSGNQLVDEVTGKATSPSRPELQNWFDPILDFKPGSLTNTPPVGSFNPASAGSYTTPAVAMSPTGEPILVFSGRQEGNAGLWIAYQQPDGSWKQAPLSVGGNACTLSPSAVYYQGKLTIAYTDVNHKLHVAWCEGSPLDASATWTSYQVRTSAAEESSQWNPTLVVERGRLAMYFPSNAGGTGKQTVRYLHSTKPFDSSGFGNWGGSVNEGKTGYTGISGTIKISGSEPNVSSPIAATTFQGRTVLAFRGYDSRDSNVENAPILLLTQNPNSSTLSDSSSSETWVKTDTGQTNSSGVGLATDQALLYLTSSNTTYKEPNEYYTKIWSLAPSAGVPGQWALGPTAYASAGYSTDANTKNNPLYSNLRLPTVLSPFLLNGKLMATWAGNNESSKAYDVRLAELRTTISSPSQQSLVGFSLDGNIDVNGDGFQDILLSDPTDPKQNVDNQYVLFGGDYLNIASQVGTAGDDVMIGTAVDDVIYSIQGEDRVTSNGGADVILTGAGNDSIFIHDNAFIRIDGGSGFNSLLLHGKAHQSYDFRITPSKPETDSRDQYSPGTRLQNIQLINAFDYGSNDLYFDAAAVNSLNSDRVLFIASDATDTIHLSSEFHRNTRFDTSLGGSLWNAYTAGKQADPKTSGPALIYVAVPTGQTAQWLNTHVAIASASLQPTALLSKAAAENAALAAPRQPVALPQASANASRTSFGTGLTLVAYRTNPSAGVATFAIERNDSTQRAVIAYASSSTNSTAKPGLDYTAVAGLLVLEAGQSRQEITVPLNSQSFALLRGGSLSLRVEELSDRGQRPLHLLLEPQRFAADGSSASASSARPVLSSFELVSSSSGEGARLQFRADSNRSDGERDSLQLMIGQRAGADARQPLSSQPVSLLDALAAGDDQGALLTPLRSALEIDNDGRDNGQISAVLDVNFAASAGEPIVSVLANNRVVPLLYRSGDSSLAIAAANTALAEGNIGSTQHPFTISRTGDLSGETRVAWAVAGAGATPANALDFAGGQLPAGIAVFAPGQDSVSLIVNVVGDGSLEADEGFRIDLSNPVGGWLGSNATTGVIQILNDDRPEPSYSFVATPEVVYEGGSLHLAISTQNVPMGRSLWWDISGAGITPSDIQDGMLTGSTQIGSDGRAAFTKTIAADSVIDPGESLQVRFYADAARRQPVGASQVVTIREASVGVVTDGNDVITGGAAPEIITGVPAGSLKRGQHSLDRLSGGPGADIFLLGDAQGSYYNDGTTALGTQDQAVITDFSAGDRIQLFGASSDYRLISGRHAGIPGVRIDALNAAPGILPEAIGFVQHVSLAHLNLANPNQFLYV